MSASRFASSPPRLPEPSGTLMASSLPMTTVPTQCPWLMTFAMRSSKRLTHSATTLPQPHCHSSLSCLFCAPRFWSYLWLRLLPPCPYQSCSWVRLSAQRIGSAMHWLLDLAWPWLAFTHGTCRPTQATSHLSPSPQALVLKVPPIGLWLSTSQHAPWRSHRTTCLWITSSLTPQPTRLLWIPHLRPPTRNLNKQLRKLNIEHWRSCLDPPQHRRLKSMTPLLPPVRHQLLPPSRHLMCQAADAVAAAVGHELLRITPWKRLLRRTSKSTCRSPSGAFRGNRIHSSLSSPTGDHAPLLPSFALLYPGAARTHDVPAERWLRFSTCVTGLPMSMQQIECNATSTWVHSLLCDPRPHPDLAAAFHAPSMPHLQSCTLSCSQSSVLQCSLRSRCHPAQNTARNLSPPPVAGVGMTSRQARRQERQSRRPGSLNRRFTDAPSADAAAPASIASSASAADANSTPSVESCRLTLKEVALLNYVSWKGRTGKPPPLTVYAEPSLQHVLRGLRQKQRQPLPTPEDEVQVVADLIHVPDDAHNNDTRDSSAKLKPKPKTKHGSAAVAPPEPSRPSGTLQPTAISSDTSLDELPCKIVAGDLTLASHDYEKNPAHARRRPKKRPKSHKGESKAVTPDADPPPPSEGTTAQKSTPATPSSGDATKHASCDTESGQRPSSSLTAALSSLTPSATVSSLRTQHSLVTRSPELPPQYLMLTWMAR